MIAELYNLAYNYAVVNGPWAAMLVLSFISAFIFFIPTFLISYKFRKDDEELPLGRQLLYYFILVFLGWIVILVIEPLALSYLFAIWKLALIGAGIYLAAWFVYNKIMNKWENLPWMVIQFAIIWVVFILIWYYLLFVAQIFGDLNFVYLM